MSALAARRSPGFRSKQLAFLRLLLTRGVPLFFRPAAIIAEGTLLDDRFLLVIVIPLASMVLMISSLPVHVDYFSQVRQPTPGSGIARSYASALTTVMALSAVLLGVAMAMTSSASPVLILGAMVYYLSEKYFDELSRWAEFRKRFGAWFLLQFLRSGWLLVPIGLALLGKDYEWAFLGVAVAVLAATQYIFSFVFGMGPRITRDGIAPIKEKWLYVLGSSLPAVYRQVPRLLVTSLFPSVAHLYVSIAQVVQATSLVFDVRVLIPYRRISVRRPRVFNRIWRRFLRVITVLSGMTGAAYLLAAGFADLEGVAPFILGALFVPVFAAEALVLSTLSFNAGLIPWFVGRRDALVTYVACLGLYLTVAIACLATGVQSWGIQAVLLFPAMNIFIGILWRAIIVSRHFGKEF